MSEPVWLYPLVLIVAIICNMAICFIIGREIGRRDAKRRTLIYEVTDDGHSATPIWTRLPRELNL